MARRGPARDCRRTRARRAAARDVASMHVLEATLIACVMVSAVTLVATYDQPLPPDQRVERFLQGKAYEFLNLLDEFPLAEDPCGAATMLERVVLEGLAGDDTTWTKRKEKLLPPGIEAHLWMHNGHDFYPIHVTREQAKGVTEEAYFTPSFDYGFAAPGVHTATGQNRFMVDQLAVRDSHLVHPVGEAVQYRVTYESPLGQGVARAQALTSVPTNVWKETPLAQNLSWTAGQYGPVALHKELSLEELGIGGDQRATKLWLRATPAVVGENRDEAILPEGLRLHVDLPPGFRYHAVSTANWNSSHQGDVTNGTHVTLKLQRDLVEEDKIQLLLYAPTDPSRPFDFIHARFGNHSMSESTLVVTYPTASLENNLPRSVHPTMPYPVRGGTRALLGATFTNGGDPVVVTQVDIEVPGGFDLRHHDGKGAPLFDPDQLLEPFGANGGSWEVVDERHVRWTGATDVTSLEATYWGVGIMYKSDAEAATSFAGRLMAPIEGNLTFDNGYRSTTSVWGASPGVLRHQVPPANASGGTDGYPWSTEGRLGGAEHAFETEVLPRDGWSLRDEGNYTLATQSSGLSAAHSAVANSSFHVRDRMAPLGSLVTADFDLRSLVSALSENGVDDMDIHVDLYAPPSRGCTPTHTWSAKLAALPGSTVQDTALSVDVHGRSAYYFLANDRVYRMSSTGRMEWSISVGAHARTIHVGTFQASGDAVLVGDAQGNVTRIDPLLGAIDWTHQVTPSRQDLPFAPVVDLDVDWTGNRILAATEADVVRLSPTSGEELTAKRSLSMKDQSVWRQVAFRTAAAGGAGTEAYALSSGHLARLDDDLVPLASAEKSGVRFVQSPAGVLVADLLEYRVHDPDTLEVQADADHAARAVLVEPGDADGDGAMDLVLALDNLDLLVIDGATAAKQEPITPPVMVQTSPVRVPRWSPATGQADCHQGGMPATYAGPARGCKILVNGDTTAPLAVAVHAGTIAYAYLDAGHGRVLVVDADGQSWQPVMEFGAGTVSHLEADAWTANQPYLVMGRDDGRISICMLPSCAGGTASDPPSETVGRFSLNLPLPKGAFFGTHVLVARVAWQDAAGATQEAQFVEWFEAVAPDGTPVQDPWYRAVLLVEDGTMPLDRRQWPCC